MFTICLHFVHTLFITDRYNVLKDKGKGYLKRVLKVNSMKRYIELNNVTFKVRHFKGELHPIKEARTLTDCYASPSEVKKEIYKQWFNWYMTVDSPVYEIVNITIHSYNTHMFTIRMDVFDNKTHNFIGCIYISKTSQEFWLA